MDFNRDVVFPEAGDDFVAGRLDVVRVLAFKGRESLDKRPRFVEGDVSESAGDLRGHGSGCEGAKGAREVRVAQLVAGLGGCLGLGNSTFSCG